VVKMTRARTNCYLLFTHTNKHQKSVLFKVMVCYYGPMPHHYSESGLVWLSRYYIPSASDTTKTHNYVLGSISAFIVPGRTKQEPFNWKGYVLFSAV